MERELLFVDDDDLFIAALWPYFEDRFRISLAQSVREAEGLLLRRRFSLIFTDLRMVDETGRSRADAGLKVIELARSGRPNRDTPVVLTSDAARVRRWLRERGFEHVTCVEKAAQGARFMALVRELSAADDDPRRPDGSGGPA